MCNINIGLITVSSKYSFIRQKYTILTTTIHIIPYQPSNLYFNNPPNFDMSWLIVAA